MQFGSISCIRDGDALRLRIAGHRRMGDALPTDADAALSAAADGRITAISCDLRELESWDTSLLVLLVRIERLAEAQGVRVSYDALPEGLRRLLRMALASRPSPGSVRHVEKESFLARTGKQVLAVPESLRNVSAFLGALIVAFCRLARGGSDMRHTDFLKAALECGLDALPIIMLTGTLFGTILAFMGAVQLVQFGAQIYVAGLVGIAMLRVMGAVLVGVVMSGRTGAAYAAHIGSMQVNEEVDALTTLGISPVEYLVLPRVLALALMVPMLTLYADLMGIFGGFLVAVFMLGLPTGAYYQATLDMVALRHLFVGLVYATVFGVIVGFCGCYHGLRCGRSAEAVGKATTAAVVHAVVYIIVATAVITVLCNILKV